MFCVTAGVYITGPHNDEFLATNSDPNSVLDSESEFWCFSIFSKMFDTCVHDCSNNFD
jgi:hypothetical protein